MNIRKSILGIAAIIAAISVTGCDNDFETLGSNIIGEPGFNAELYDETFISATNVDLGPVQTNNLPLNLLGHYEHQVYGPQTASIYTQLELSTANPNFGDGVELDSVVMKIPYFSHEIEPDDDGSRNYALDSVFGNGTFKLTVAESNFFLNQFDPETDFETAQKYYSNLTPEVEANLTGKTLYQNNNFRPSADEVVEYGIGSLDSRDTLREAPALRIKLSTEFFREKILLKEGSLELSSNSYFRNYLRGLYLKAEPVEPQSSLLLLNLSHADAGITLYFSKEQEVEETAEEEEGEEPAEPRRIISSYKLKFGSGEVNLFKQEAPQFDAENIYLKGGEGAMAKIELFSGPDSDADGVSDELEALRENEWLINEANLIFYVNQEKMGGSREPERLYLYDLDNNRMLIDYVLDAPGEENRMNSTSNLPHSVPLERDEDENGIRYKLRLTRHVNNLLNSDSTNVNLGLVVNQNINLLSNSAVKDSEVEKVPVGSVISPYGTVLHGPDSQDDEKRLKLNIYYTESKE